MQSELVSTLSGLFTPSLPHWLTVYHESFQAAKYSKQVADGYLLDLHVFSNGHFPLSCLSSRTSTLIGWLMHKAMPWMHSNQPSIPLRGVFVLGYQSSAVMGGLLWECEAAPSMVLTFSPLQGGIDWFVYGNRTACPLPLTTIYSVLLWYTQ